LKLPKWNAISLGRSKSYRDSLRLALANLFWTPTSFVAALGPSFLMLIGGLLQVIGGIVTLALTFSLWALARVVLTVAGLMGMLVEKEPA
jgi:hypothetical protein